MSSTIAIEEYAEDVDFDSYILTAISILVILLVLTGIAINNGWICMEEQEASEAADIIMGGKCR